jgi:LCP family protein required for cell wall assembly
MKRSVTGGRRARSSYTPALLAMLVVVACGLAGCLSFAAIGTPEGLLPGNGGRTNVLLLGVDRRKGDGWTYRTDTIMILTADPGTGRAGLLSIPRDLQVPIPGHGEDRINTSNVYGYLEGYPGGGPALLRDTIEANFGSPIDGHIMLDFRAFERLVDDIGGIEVCVPETLHDTRYPDPRPGDPHAFKTVHFDPGCQQMDGEQALMYARSRMSTSDFDRAARQQQILLSIRERVSNPGVVVRLPLVAMTFLDAVNTDLSAPQVLALGLFVARTDPAQLRRVVLEPPLVYAHRRADGAAVQLPDWPRIYLVIDDLFGPAGSR